MLKLKLFKLKNKKMLKIARHKLFAYVYYG